MLSLGVSIYVYFDDAFNSTHSKCLFHKKMDILVYNHSIIIKIRKFNIDSILLFNKIHNWIFPIVQIIFFVAKVN